MRDHRQLIPKRKEKSNTNNWRNYEKGRAGVVKTRRRKTIFTVLVS